MPGCSCHGYVIVETYADGGKSGLTIKHREALGHLLQDIISGRARFGFVLVYDVSRWGRFQNADEAAHYEFMCTNAGVPVYYCAEQFPNDGTMPSSVMKALKRTMAAEFSRELSARCYAGLKRLTLLGFRAGGRPKYGYQRMLVAADKRRNRVLRDGEHKCLSTDRGILAPGPALEVASIKEMFRIFTEEKGSSLYVTRELNRRGITFRGANWNVSTVLRMLQDPTYCGDAVWGDRKSTRL